MKTGRLLLVLAAGFAMSGCEQPAQQEQEDTPEPETGVAGGEPAGALPPEGTSPATREQGETTLQEEAIIEQDPDRPATEPPVQETEDDPVDDPPPR